MKHSILRFLGLHRGNKPGGPRGSSGGASRERTVLLVDLQPAGATFLENPVQQLGFRVHAVGTEAQALEALSQGGVAAVVVTGPASVPFLRALRCATSAPILALDSQADDNRVLEAYDSGVDQFVARPISAQEVVARLTALLRRSR